MSVTIHQLLAGATNGDAITQFAINLNSFFTKKKINSNIFAPSTNTHDSLKHDIFSLSEFNQKTKKDDILLYHYSIGSETTDIYKCGNFKRVLCYHNITPYEYFLPYSDGYASLLREGYDELNTLKEMTDYTITVSNFNKKCLMEAGFKNIQTLPLILTSSYLETAPQKKILQKLNNSSHNILFVGRVVPNKNFEDLIKTFAFYKLIQKDAKLYLIGQYDIIPTYYNYLNTLISKYKIEKHVIFTGKVRIEELIAYYKGAQAFLCLSLHEGFCIPLMESMYYNLPIFALNTSVINDTLKGSGILINKNDYRKTAELLDIILNNKNLVKEITERQKKVFLDFIDSSSLWENFIDTIIN